MGISYYDALLPVREPRAALRTAMTALRLPYRVLASIGLPAGRVVVAFVSDSTRLSRMFAANWAPAGTDQEPDATLYALAGPACRYGLDESWDRARWWSADHKMMTVFGFGSWKDWEWSTAALLPAVDRAPDQQLGRSRPEAPLPRS
jgi:hypothetical protein